MTTEISKGKLMTGRIMCWLVVAALGLSGIAKFFPQEEMMELFGGTGYEGLISLLAVIEISVVILYAIPATRGFGTLAVIAFLGGIIATEWNAAHPPIPGIALSIIFWVGNYLTRPHIFKV